MNELNAKVSCGGSLSSGVSSKAKVSFSIRQVENGFIGNIQLENWSHKEIIANNIQEALDVIKTELVK